MPRLCAAILVLALTAGPALAQSRAPLFMSPMGEPFRGVDGEAPLHIWFRAADADQNGALTREEFVAQAMPFHGVLDRNQDGVVAASESGALFRATAPEIFALPPPPARLANIPREAGRIIQERNREPEGPQGPRGAARFGLLNDIEPVMSCDADLSRWVTVAEFQTCAERRFALLDANGDGAFALAESPRVAELLDAPTEE